MSLQHLINNRSWSCSEEEEVKIQPACSLLQLFLVARAAARAAARYLCVVLSCSKTTPHTSVANNRPLLQHLPAARAAARNVYLRGCLVARQPHKQTQPSPLLCCTRQQISTPLTLFRQPACEQQYLKHKHEEGNHTAR